jgi:VIT1/CCC1 family predicted Fe2+/Mn2+ transporter
MKTTLILSSLGFSVFFGFFFLIWQAFFFETMGSGFVTSMLAIIASLSFFSLCWTLSNTDKCLKKLDKLDKELEELRALVEFEHQNRKD